MYQLYYRVGFVDGMRTTRKTSMLNAKQNKAVETCLNIVKNSSLFFTIRFQLCPFTFKGDEFT
jgi:hypothetical protein